MPVVSMFYGILIYMYFYDTKQHHRPHIHAHYQGDRAVVDIESAELLDGSIPNAKLRLVQAWVELHRDELMADWELASKGEAVFKIDPLR